MLIIPKKAPRSTDNCLIDVENKMSKPESTVINWFGNTKVEAVTACLRATCSFHNEKAARTGQVVPCDVIHDWKVLHHTNVCACNCTSTLSQGQLLAPQSLPKCTIGIDNFITYQ